MKTAYFTIKIPGKTFISGEYLALFGGSSLLVSTDPGFQVFFLPKRMECPQSELLTPFCKKYNLTSDYFDTEFLNKVHSPVGIFYQKHFQELKDWEILFYDGYQKKGGFGASTAQFLALYHFYHFIKNDFINLNISEESIKSALLEYWQSQSDSKTILPSGNDLLAQHFPGFNIISKDGKMTNLQDLKINHRSVHWKFKNLNFILTLTGNKTPTHQHLQNIKNFEEVDKKKLLSLQDQLEKDFELGNEDTFIEGINQWSKELHQLHFVCENTQKIVKDFDTNVGLNKGTRAIKGCGALGSDVLFILFDKSQLSKVKDWLKRHHLLTYYTSFDVWTKPVKMERHLWI